MTPTTRPTESALANIFRPSLLAWRANYLAAKAAAGEPAPKPAPPRPRRRPADARR